MACLVLLTSTFWSHPANGRVWWTPQPCRCPPIRTTMVQSSLLSDH